MGPTSKAALAIFSALLAAALLAIEVEARGRGGGGRGGGRGGGGFSRPNISRSGPASGGSFRGGGRSYGGGSRGYGGSYGNANRTAPSQRPSRQVANDRPRTRDDRPDNRNDRLDDRQDFRQDNIENRQDYRDKVRKEYKEHEEWYEDRWRYMVGSSITVATFRTMTCQTNVVVINNITYYNCSGTWYNRAYSGGSVTYVVVNTPAGY